MSARDFDIAAVLTEHRRLLYRAHSAGFTDAYDTEAEFKKRAMAQADEIIAAFAALRADNEHLIKCINQILQDCDELQAELRNIAELPS